MSNGKISGRTSPEITPCGEMGGIEGRAEVDKFDPDPTGGYPKNIQK